MDAKKAPIAPLGTMFWFRPSALKKLFEHPWTYEDFPAEPTGMLDGNILHAIERVYPFVAQASGYYSGWLLSEDFARLEITNLNHIAHENQRKICEKADYIVRMEPLLAEKEQWIDRYAAQRTELAEVYNSRSWRLTKPLRKLFSLFRRS